MLPISKTFTIGVVSLIVLFFTTGTGAFSPSATPFGVIPSTTQQRRSCDGTRLNVGPNQGGGAALAKPKVSIGQKTATVTKQKTKSTQKSKTDEPVRRKENDFEDAPMYKVMLIGDEEYEQAHCIQRMVEVLEDMDEDHAATVFSAAQAVGKSMCGKYPKEHAELYVEQLLRSDPMIYSELEEDVNKGKK